MIKSQKQQQSKLQNNAANQLNSGKQRPQFLFAFLFKQIFFIDMIEQIKSVFKLFHSILVIYLTFSLYEINKTLPHLLIGAEIATTILITLIDRKQTGRDWKQLLFGLSLVYALRPTELNVLRFLFLAKIFYVHQSLTSVSESIFTGSWKFFRLLKIAFDFSRLAVVFYLFLGCLIVVYKYWAYLWTDPEKVLSTHQILYFFMITSSSIGYGDITPKNQYQMYFLIAFIPVLCIAFGQFSGHAVSCFNDFIAILRENPMSNIKANLLSEAIWGKQECNNLIDYIAHSQSKNASIQQSKKLFANNWISIACKNIESHQPLLEEILDQSDSKQYRLLVSSKLKRKFYPKNWKIIERGNIDRRIYLIDQGEVQVRGKTLGAGKTFNFSGFSHEEPSSETYLTKSFTSVWSISQSDLSQIGRSSMNLMNKISKRTSLNQS